MRECWINVYDKPIYNGWRGCMGKECDRLRQAEAVSYNVYIVSGVKTIYRIHVRMK